MLFWDHLLRIIGYTLSRMRMKRIWFLRLLLLKEFSSNRHFRLWLQLSCLQSQEVIARIPAVRMLLSLCH
uniref:Uncharacterized protein n=1 Tax=Lotus japonicus TaxID=34305 RepID=I3T542_LOTJA|nr:unknown [Lotus japonicus]